MGERGFNAPKFGLFSAQFTGTGDVYGMKAKTGDTRCKDKQFETRGIVKGKGPTATFSRPLRLFEGEMYTTLTQVRNRERAAELASQPDKEAFRPPNPGKISTGPGTFHGLFGPKVEYKEDGVYSRPKVFGGKETLPNILTNPSKKGSYGVNGTTLGYVKGSKGVMGEFEYKADPYDGARIAAKAAKAAAREAYKDLEPFRPNNPTKKGTYGTPGTTINSQSYLKVGGVTGVCGEYKYVESGPEPRKARAEPDPNARDPFKPSAPPKSGKLGGKYGGTIGKFPEFKDDPYELKTMYEKASLMKSRELKTNTEPFRPSSYSKSTATRSVFRMNIARR